MSPDHELSNLASWRDIAVWIGQSMSHLVFSTLDHHRFRDEPPMTIEFNPPDEVRIAHGKNNLFFSPSEVEYSLPFEPALATCRRFLCQHRMESVLRGRQF
jgi:hypothetical protein